MARQYITGLKEQMLQHKYTNTQKTEKTNDKHTPGDVARNSSAPAPNPPPPNAPRAGDSRRPRPVAVPPPKFRPPPPPPSPSPSRSEPAPCHRGAARGSLRRPPASPRRRGKSAVSAWSERAWCSSASCTKAASAASSASAPVPLAGSRRSISWRKRALRNESIQRG